MSTEKHNIYFITRDELTKVCLDDVMYAVSDGNYITLKFKSGRTLTLLASLQNLIQIAETISDVHFERIGRGLIVNIAYVSQVNSLRKTVILVDDQMKMTVELMVPKEAIRQFKQILADTPKRPIPDFHTTNGNMEAFEIIEKP